MPPVSEPTEDVSGSGPSGRDAARPKPVWLRIVIFLGIAGVSLVVLYGIFLVLIYLMFREPPIYQGVESRFVEGEIEPGQTVLAEVDVSVDMNELFASFDRMKIELTLTEPSPQAAVFGSFAVEDVGATRPALLGETVDVEKLDVPYPCGEDAQRCVIPVEVQLGNVGTTPERWTLRAVISRDTRDKEQADAFEVPSLRTQLSASTAGRDEWASPGPISFDASTELVAYSVTVDTSVSDPSLFEVVVTEPRHWLVTRTIEAVIGPQDLSWSLVYYDPSPQPLAQQARCDQNGCQLNLVALFRPRRDDWWIPIVRPTATAPPDLLKQHSTNVEIEQINITEVSGLLGEQKPSGNLTLRIEGEANMTQAALAILVYPEDDFEWAIPRLRTDDGQTPQSYRWFNLECDEQRCVRDVEVTWDLPNRTEPIPLEYWITVIGGTGDGLANRQPPSITIEK